jgi:hypothetical protein
MYLLVVWYQIYRRPVKFGSLLGIPSRELKSLSLYILYIMSHVLLITKGSSGQTVSSSHARPGPGVYKRRPGVLEFSFWHPTPIHERQRHQGVCDGGSCTRAREATDLRTVVAVAAVPRSGVVAAVPRSAARWRRRGPGADKRRRPRGPRRRHFQGGRASGAPDVRVAMAPHEAWSSSGVMEGVRCAQRRSCVISSDSAQFRAGPSDDIYPFLCHQQRPSATTSSDRVMSFDYCVLCLPHALFTLKIVWFYAWTRNLYISLLLVYFLHAHWKDNFLIYGVVITIKNQIKSLMFVTDRFLRLP